MIYIIAILLLLFAAIEWLHVRALRENTSVTTVLHAEVADLGTHVEKLESKFDGGAIPK